MRLDRYISNNTPFSRSDVKKLVKAGRISLNDAVADSPNTQVVTARDIVCLDGKHIEPIGDIYLMLNKPKGFICATQDDKQPTVIDLLRGNTDNPQATLYSAQINDLQIVGRLDIDTTGILLLTNNGQWNHTVTSPVNQCKKVYLATLAEPLSRTAIEQFAHGVQLEGETKPTRPAILEPVTTTKARVTLTEGKYHQVKRMFAATGNHVTGLHRESIGPVSLDRVLKPGQFRYLTTKERDSLAKRNTNTQGIF